MWALRVVGLISLGGVFWLRQLPEAAWAVWGGLALGALLASVWERRRNTIDATLIALIADSALAGAVFWALQGVAWAYWLFVVPLLRSFYRWGAIGAVSGGLIGAGAIYAAAFALRPEAFIPTDPATLSWMGGVLALGLALGWGWRERTPANHKALLQRAEQAIWESETAERCIRERYRELAYQYHRLEEHLVALQDAAELLHALQQARDPNTLHQAILERLRARFGASGAALYLTDESGALLRLVCALGSLARLEKTVAVSPAHPFQKKPLPQQVIDQLRTEALHCERLPEAHSASPARADALVLPLQIEARMRGVVMLSTRSTSGFTPEIRLRLNALTPYLAGLIDLTEQLRLMSIRLAETQLLYDLENLLFCAETTESLPQHALRLLKSVLPYEHAQLLLKRGERLELAAQSGAMPDLRNALPSLINSEVVLRQGQILNAVGEQAQRLAPAQSLIIVPLRGSARWQGIVALGRTELPPFHETDLETLHTLAFQLTNVLERAQLLSDLERLATTDGLTGLYNYRHFQDRYREEVNLCRRYQHPMAIMLIDLDGFKQVNDQYGHIEGDYLLMQLAEVLQNTLRTTELVARYGGDEFVVLMPSTNLQGGVAAAKRVAQAVRDTQFLDTLGNPRLKISVSIGVAAYPNSTDDPAEVLEKADAALEIAKRSGRNQVVALENTA